MFSPWRRIFAKKRLILNRQPGSRTTGTLKTHFRKKFTPHSSPRFLRRSAKVPCFSTRSASESTLEEVIIKHRGAAGKHARSSPSLPFPSTSSLRSQRCIAATRNGYARDEDDAACGMRRVTVTARSLVQIASKRAEPTAGGMEGASSSAEGGRIIRRPFVNLRASVGERGRDARVRSPFCRSRPRIEMLSA